MTLGERLLAMVICIVAAEHSKDMRVLWYSIGLLFLLSAFLYDYAQHAG